MDKLIIEFNKKFDKQKQELIDGFKALGEEKRLPKVLETIEGEQPTYKNYFKAGWQSRQAELDQAYEDIETFAQAHQRECDIKVQIANELKEKDKRIEEIENKLLNLSSMYSTKAAEFNLDNEQELATVCNEISQSLEALRGEHANS